MPVGGMSLKANEIKLADGGVQRVCILVDGRSACVFACLRQGITL